MKTNPKAKARARRKKHIRKTVVGNTARPRLCIFRSENHIYAQVIDDTNHSTVASASSLKMAMDEGATGGNLEGAKAVGKAVAAAAIAANVRQVVFDRNGYLYHGRVAALADAAREAGLEF
ncbi:MAG: 50S ribosomal protein L18 [Alphaproteobacteria bacterium]|nr:50S ribosomal protein L18 [Alphaproteobacteria bacterium]MCB9696134.1 50S ribosomal protein L18 [Alphaproteobacteria bacterium]